jgi:hypothetical protein
MRRTLVTFIVALACGADTSERWDRQSPQTPLTYEQALALGDVRATSTSTPAPAPACAIREAGIRTARQGPTQRRRGGDARHAASGFHVRSAVELGGKRARRIDLATEELTSRTSICRPSSPPSAAISARRSIR